MTPSQNYLNDRLTPQPIVIHEKTIRLFKSIDDWSFSMPNSLPKLIASLYCSELFAFKKHWHKDNLNTILLENAIWLHPKNDFLLLIDEPILQAIHEMCVKTTFRDRAVLHAIANSGYRHTMSYYFAKADEIVSKFSAKIAEHLRLSELKNHYQVAGNALEKAFLGGMDACLAKILSKKPLSDDDCPYSEENLSQAWRDGYLFGEIESRIWCALLRC